MQQVGLVCGCAATLTVKRCCQQGTEFTTAEVQELRRLYRASAVSVPWERGDILLCDNLRTSHGRAAFEGERSVVAMLGGRLRRCGDRSVELLTG